MTKLTKPLKPEWEQFCQYFACHYETFGNATVSYARAYQIDIQHNKSKYASCRTQGYRLLTKDDILRRINQLLADLVMNDTTVDMELAFLIAQKNDFGAKIQAIKEYNKLKQRIVDRVKIQTEDPVAAVLGKLGLIEGEKDAGQNKGTEETPS